MPRMNPYLPLAQSYLRRVAKPQKLFAELARISTDALGTSARIRRTRGFPRNLFRWGVFVLVVLVPTAIYFLYAAFVETSGYVTETRVSVRSAQEQRAKLDAASVISKVVGSQASTAQDSYLLLNYIKSAAMVIDLGGRAYFEPIYSRSGIDVFTRLSKNAPMEKITDYWNGHVEASVDTISGILTLRVTAYSAQESFRIADDVYKLSESFINNMTLRIREDSLARAAQEVSHAGDDLAQSREQLLLFRNSTAIIDPGSEAAKIGDILGKLTLEKVEIETNIESLKQNLDSTAPSLRTEYEKLKSVQDQIATYRGKLTQPNTDSTVSSQIARYERLKLNEMFDEAIYSIAKSARLGAQTQLDRRQFYLVSIVAPMVPDSSSSPRVVANTILMLVSLFLAWAIAALIAASIYDVV